MKFVKTLILIVLISGLVVFFQNCGVQQNTGLLGGKSSLASVADKIVTDAPFAYDLVVDTISYNSCVGDNLNNSGIHGLRVGANEGFTDSVGNGSVNAGLKLNSEFLKYVGDKVKPSYPSSVITPAQIQNLLVNSTTNKDAYLQFAVRKAADLSVAHDIIQPTAPITFSLPRDGVVIQSPLFQDPVLTNLTKSIQFGPGGVVLAEGLRVYNLQADSTPAPIQASFGYSNYADESFDKTQPNSPENLGIGERYSETVRNKFNLGTAEKYILAISYGPLSLTGTETTGIDNGLNSPKRKDEKDKSKAFGRSFALQFGLPVSPAAAGWKNTALKSVTESNLADAAPVSGSSWACRSYVILQSGLWNSPVRSKASCSGLLSADLSDPIIRNQVKNLRRHYTEDSWDVGFFYDADANYDPTKRPKDVGTNVYLPLCLVPKKAECYLPTNTILPPADVGVNYNPGTECYLSNQVGTTYSNPIDTVKAGGRCAQFASICVRTR